MIVLRSLPFAVMMLPSIALSACNVSIDRAAGTTVTVEAPPAPLTTPVARAITPAQSPTPLFTPDPLVDGVTHPPVLIKSVPPNFRPYTPTHLPRRWRFTINVTANGDVGDVHVQTKADAELVDRLVGAVRQWKFHPATRNGAPVAAPIAVTIHSE